MDERLQAEYDKKYQNGMLAKTVQILEKEVDEQKEELKKIQGIISEFIGSLKAVKYIVSVLGITTIVQIIFTITKSIGG